MISKTMGDEDGLAEAGRTQFLAGPQPRQHRIFLDPGEGRGGGGWCGHEPQRVIVRGEGRMRHKAPISQDVTQVHDLVS